MAPSPILGDKSLCIERRKKPKSGLTDSNGVDTRMSKQNTAHVPELRDRKSDCAVRRNDLSLELPDLRSLTPSHSQLIVWINLARHTCGLLRCRVSILSHRT
jgi:hypothetical protein